MSPPFFMYTGTFFEFDFTDVSRTAIKKKLRSVFKNQHTGRKSLYRPTSLYPISYTLAQAFTMTMKNGFELFG